MKKIICDKCGNEIEKDSMDHFKIGIDKPLGEGELPNLISYKEKFRKGLALCSQCFKEFEESFLKGSSESIEMHKKFIANQKQLEDLRKKGEIKKSGSFKKKK